MTKTTLLFFALISIVQHTYAQYTITGRIADEHDNGVPFANVLLIKISDSTQVNGAVADQDGNYILSDVKRGDFILQSRSIGYVNSYSTQIPFRTQLLITMDDIICKEGSTELDEVIVKSSKLQFEVKKDRMVMNVGALPSMNGNSGLELLQRIPGLVVDRQNNSISMIPKGEVLIMINDKVQRLPAEVLMTQLQGIRTENIEQIEIIQQPPAKYDASGAAGIINIVLKKNDQKGTNGSISLMGGYGQREKASLSLNLNSRHGIFNWYGNYNYNRSRANRFTVDHFREYDYQGDRYYYENFVITRNYSEGLHAASLGLDLDFSEHTTVGLLLGGTISRSAWGEDADSRSYGYINYDLVSSDDYWWGSKTDMQSLTANANVFQKTGVNSHLNFNLDYSNIEYENYGYLANRKDAYYAINYDRTTPMEFWISSLDYVKRFANEWTLESGLKGTINNTLSTTAIHNISDESWSERDLFSGGDKIREQILAAYSSLSGQVSDKLDAEIGVRFEHYNYQLRRDGEQNFENIINRPFPVFRLNYKMDSLNTLQFGYNRSITRPSFFHLTSFLLLFDPSLIIYANPQLQPTFTNNLKITWQRKSAILSLAYLSRVNKIYFYNTVDKENHLQTSVPNNLDQENIIEATLGIPISPARWWEMNFNLIAYYHRVRDASDRPSQFVGDIYTYSVQLNSTFYLGKSWSLGFDGRYMTHYLDGDQRKYDYPYLNLGLKKEFSSGSNLSISVQDISNTAGKRTWEYDQPELGIRTYGANNFSERQLRVTYTTTFGNQKISGKRERKTGSEEIKNRM